MVTIQSSNKKIKELWPEGKAQDATYRLFGYLLTVKVDNGLLMLNTVTGELILLDEIEQGYLSNLPCDYEQWMEELIQKHFLVRIDLDDQKSVNSLRTALRMVKDSKNITAYTVLPTTNCNARCFYCYECGIKREDMSDATADKLVEFIDINRGGRPIDIAWFGGEPLVGTRQINRICSALMERNIPFHSRMTSNGYLFDEEIAKHAKHEWNIEAVQITLDGTEKIYNQTKAYINPCENPYKKVLANIGYLLKNKIEVEIRMNLGLHNADDLENLVDEIAERFEDKTNLKVYTNILFDGCGAEPIHFSDEELSNLLMKNKALFEKLCQYSPVIYRTPLPRLSTINCAIDTSAVVVFPSGKLGKCQHYSNKHFVGDLYNGITDTQEVSLLRERVTFSKCYKCPLYPSCVKLKYCEINHDCHPLKEEYEINDVLNNMKLYYEDYLNKVEHTGGEM